MKYRVLGKYGPKVSIVGFGAWGIGGLTSNFTSYGATKDSVSIAAIEAALEEGINLFDTAIAYGNGKSEELIARVAKEYGSDMVIASKAGFWSFDKEPDFSYNSILRSTEKTVRRFGGRPLDVLQLHSISRDILDTHPRLFDSLEEVKKRGLIKAVGVSVKNPNDALPVIKHALNFDVQLTSVQVNLNMLDTRAIQNGLLDYCHMNGVGVIARTPLCFGFLSGTISESSKFPVGDHRLGWPKEQLKSWSDGARKMLSLAGSDGRDVQKNVELAVRFCFSHAGVSSVIPGILTPNEAKMNAGIGKKNPLPEMVFKKVLNANEQEEFFVRK